MEIPMLDEVEYRVVTSKHGPKETGSRAEIVKSFHGPVLREYERITGFHETNPNAVTTTDWRCTVPRVRTVESR
jgi:hypothetical protein